MYIFDVSNPITLILFLSITLLLIFLGKELKKPFIPGVALACFIILAIAHAIQITQIPASDDGTFKSLLIMCIAIDFVMIFISFIGYLWIDDIASKFYKKKSVDNSLDWFWRNV